MAHFAVGIKLCFSFCSRFCTYVFSSLVQILMKLFWGAFINLRGVAFLKQIMPWYRLDRMASRPRESDNEIDSHENH